jgi:flagellar biosynthesis GTPase FlhF
MRYVCSAATVLVLSVLAVSPAWAQSLGDVARKEEERRKAMKTAGKVYTNDTLRKEPEAAPPSTPAAPSSRATAAAAPAPSSSQPQAQSKTGEPAATPQPDQKKKDETFWRGRITEARQNLARAQVFQDALQSRINALTTDFVNRDDPAQRRVIEADRLKALAELDRVKKEIAQFKKAIADIEEEARRAAVPPGWLR